MWIGAGLLALYLYNDVKSGIRKLKDVGYVTKEQSQIESDIVNAGGKVHSSTLGTFYAINGGSVRLPETVQLRRYESAMVWLDKYIPFTDWLTRKVYS
jgi:hypothetical protein